MTKLHSPLLVKAAETTKLVHQKVAKVIKPGFNLLDIELLVEREITKSNMLPAFRGFKNYPNCSCISVNHMVVQGLSTNY